MMKKVLIIAGLLTFFGCTQEEGNNEQGAYNEETENNEADYPEGGAGASEEELEEYSGEDITPQVEHNERDRAVVDTVSSAEGVNEQID